MKILLDNEEKKKFYPKFGNLKKTSKLKRWGNKKITRLNRIEYVTFAGKEVEEKRLVNFFNVLENRYQMALYCLNEIRKDCKIVEDSEIALKKMDEEMKDNSVYFEFAIKCEYFIFAMCSCLDNMAQIINLIYDFGIKPKSVGISTVYDEMKRKRDGFSRFLLKEWKKWIDELKDIRNKMTHHQIIQFSSNVSHLVEKKKVIFTKHCISVLDDKGNEITKQLPTYFDEIMKNYKNLNYEFYKKINSQLDF